MLRSLFGSKAHARVFLPPGLTLPAGAVEAHRRRHPAATGQTKAGQTQNFIVFSDGTADGDTAAKAMLNSAEADYAATKVWFGGLTPPGLPFYVYADPNAGGAYHMTCAGTDVHVLSDPVRAPGFLTAEIVEVFEAAINNGWDCAVTNGESLSRVLAFERHPEIAAGCGDLFLYYLHAQLTFDWTTLCGAGGPTLGATYKSLTGYDPMQGFNDFIASLSTIAQ